MAITTIYKASDGTHFDTKADAESHDRLLGEITAFCQMHGVKEGRTTARACALILAWEAYERAALADAKS